MSAAESELLGGAVAPSARGAVGGREVVRGPLPELLAWFSSSVTGAVLAEPAIGRVLTRGPRLSAGQRLQLYQYAYRARLIECLADDYPGVKYALGCDGFEVLAGKYIDAYPSRAPSLNYYGRNFSAFAAGLGEEFVADLSRLEWAMVEVVHAPPSPVLSMAMLQELPPEAWANIRFHAAPSLRFHEFNYPVNKYLRAAKTDQSPSLPDREWSATAVYRKEYVIWRMNFSKPMAAVLSSLLRGEPLGIALADLPEDLAGDVMTWFREWVSGGFFEKLDFGLT